MDSLARDNLLDRSLLAALISVNAGPTRPWLALADQALDRTGAPVQLASRQERPLPTIKDAACAWRQAIFFASMVRTEVAGTWLRSARDRHASTGPMADVIGGLAHILSGGRFDRSGYAPTGDDFSAGRQCRTGCSQHRRTRSETAKASWQSFRMSRTGEPAHPVPAHARR